MRQAIRRLLARGLPRGRQAGVRILSYHKVNDSLPERLSVPTTCFGQQMKWMRDSGQVLSLEEAVQRMKSGGDTDGIVVTFDDGFADNYESALPALMECGVSATFFLCSEYVGTDRVFDRDREAPDANRFLSWEQVREMHSSGMTIGAHTASHVKPCSVSVEEFGRQVERSKKTIEDRLGAACEYFAYPWGRARDFGQRHVEVVREAGFRAALTTMNGVNGAEADLFRLRRTTVYGGDDLGTFARVMQGRLDGFSLKNVGSEAWSGRR